MDRYEIDNIISLMRKFTNSASDGELDEQEGTAPAGGGGAKPSYPTVTKWESGVTRGVANQVGLTKWREITKITRGKANTLL